MLSCAVSIRFNLTRRRFAFCFSVSSGFVFLGTPKEVWWLTPEEKNMAHARIIRNKTGTVRAARTEKKRRVEPDSDSYLFSQDIVGGKFKWDQVKEALVDPVTWL